MGGRYCAINSPLGPRWGKKSLDLRSRDFCPPPWTSWWVNCAIPTAHVVSLYNTSCHLLIIISNTERHFRMYLKINTGLSSLDFIYFTETEMLQLQRNFGCWSPSCDFMMTSSNENIFPSQRPVTRCFNDFFDLCLNKRLNKQSRRRWFETPSRSLCRHCNGKLWFCSSSGNYDGIIYHTGLVCDLGGLTSESVSIHLNCDEDRWIFMGYLWNGTGEYADSTLSLFCFLFPCYMLQLDRVFFKRMKM